MNDAAVSLARRDRVSRTVILDDTSEPGARVALGRLLARSSAADFAIDRVRLAAIDFQDRDLAGIDPCRVMLGRLDVHALIDAVDSASRAPAAAANIAVLRRFMASGRLQLRSAGARRWRPDFCILRGVGLQAVTRGGAVSLVGHLGIGAPADRGPNLTCVVAGADGIGRAAAAFERLWTDGHDVLDVVAETLDRFAGRG